MNYLHILQIRNTLLNNAIENIEEELHEKEIINNIDFFSRIYVEEGEERFDNCINLNFYGIDPDNKKHVVYIRQLKIENATLDDHWFLSKFDFIESLNKTLKQYVFIQEFFNDEKEIFNNEKENPVVISKDIDNAVKDFEDFLEIMKRKYSKNTQ